MPEGPSLIFVKEAAAKFIGKIIFAFSGNSKIDQSLLIYKKIIELKSWKKHFHICLNGLTLRVPFLMFGSYTINERKPERAIRLNLTFENGEINFYTCSVKYLEGDIRTQYDWTVDVMNDLWSKTMAKSKLEATPGELICDVLLDQNIFSGVGNIIKNETFYRGILNPLSEKYPMQKLMNSSMIPAFTCSNF